MCHSLDLFSVAHPVFLLPLVLELTLQKKVPGPSLTPYGYRQRVLTSEKNTSKQRVRNQHFYAINLLLDLLPITYYYLGDPATYHVCKMYVWEEAGTKCTR